jgi:hypothetical protein
MRKKKKKKIISLLTFFNLMTITTTTEKETPMTDKKQTSSVRDVNANHTEFGGRLLVDKDKVFEYNAW